MGKPVGKRPLGRPRRRWEDNNKIDLQEMGWGMDFIDLVHEGDSWRVVNAVMNLRVPQNGRNLQTGRESVSFSRRTLLHGASK